jgi:hypothetical protein
MIVINTHQTQKMSKRQGSKKKHTIVLKLNNLAELHEKYGIDSMKKTVIEESSEFPTEMQFHDELRKIHKCCVSAVQFQKSGEYCCFWDRHPFSTVPFGCPIEYSPKIISRVYNSEITKDTFVVNESVASNQSHQSEHTIIKTKDNEHYESDGIFCSLNCALAFAKDNAHNPVYSRSCMLIQKVYQEIVENKTSLLPAPSWRLLKEYGGLLTIDEFRKNFQRMTYESRGIQRLAFRPISFVFEEKYKL